MKKGTSIRTLLIIYIIVVSILFGVILTVIIKGCRAIREIGLKTIANELWEGTE